ncbi:MAG: threonine ammonia-lyase [Clostridiales bacterium]|nr:threonine ammonia-lyase [Candidatus Cacconaster stercorequi]
MLSMDMLHDAQRVLSPVINQTPMIPAKGFVPDCKFYLKADCLQKTGAFKLRGAYYKISSLSDEEKSRGVIACSAGNHAQGVAFAARDMGIDATICIPEGAPLSKIEATRSYGANVVLVPGVYDDAYNEACRLRDEKGLTFIHPFDDYQIMAGQGTIGLEIIEQLPDVDVVFVPIGGGGLISGVAYAIKHLKPECKVIGVQAAGAPSMYKSIKGNRIITLDSVDTMADGIKVKTPGDLTFDMCRKYVDEVVTVSETEIASAILTVLEKQKLVAEGAGAVGIAAAMYGNIDLRGKTVCAVLSGGNVDVTMLERIITRGLAKAGRTMSFATVLPDKPKTLAGLLNIVSDLGANILEVNHERSNLKADLGSCVVHLLLETRDHRHIEQIYDHLRSHGYLILER